MPLVPSNVYRSVLASLLAGVGCVSSPPAEPGPPFVFPDESLAFANELISAYEQGPDGHLRMVPREVPAEYGQNCVAMIRAARLFHAHAHFDATLPRASEAIYRERIEAVLASDPRQKRPGGNFIVIPGYENLYAFSQGEKALLQILIDDRWGAYLQRGNWRMILPFSRAQQARSAESLLAGVRRGDPPVVHVIRFPKIDINHMVLVYAAEETPDSIFFEFYDPNYPGDHLRMRYDRARRTFEFERDDFFSGGAVRAYEVYDGPIY